ncbi:MAG TPA: helix-turn-helix domain-containing protein [Chloroflexota bacterium]|nr:helix-turn-helix domain-containing protein [Chloroflexota bacterium]
MSVSASESGERRIVLRKAIQRLLAWGFSPSAIARELGCSPSYVYAVRRERVLMYAEEEASYRPLGALFDWTGR